jgi:hypothetical protein
MLRQAMGNLDSQDSPRPGLGGSYHLPLYSILYASPRSPHLNNILSRDSHLAKLGLSQLWGPITLRADLRLKWGLKKSCNLCQELFNGMSHATWTHGNKVDSWLLVVRNQIVNLTPNLSFGHNLCFKCPNGSSKPISNIYFPTSFQWYK